MSDVECVTSGCSARPRHGRAYYNCYPANNNADRLDRYPADHQKAIYVREDVLIEALGHVIATRVFSADRHAYLRRGLAKVPNKRQEAITRRAMSLREQVADLTSRQDRLIEEVETADGAFRDRLRRRFDILEADRATKLAQLHDLETTTAAVEPDPIKSAADGFPYAHCNLPNSQIAAPRKAGRSGRSRHRDIVISWL